MTRREKDRARHSCLLAGEGLEEGPALGGDLRAAAAVAGRIVLDGALEAGLVGGSHLVGAGAEDVGGASTADVGGVGGGAAGDGLDVLAQTGLNGVVVLEHVAAAATSGGNDGGLERGGLEVLGRDLVELGGVGVVASTAAAVRDEHFDGGLEGWLKRRWW